MIIIIKIMIVAIVIIIVINFETNIILMLLHSLRLAKKYYDKLFKVKFYIHSHRHLLHLQEYCVCDMQFYKQGKVLNV